MKKNIRDIYIIEIILFIFIIIFNLLLKTNYLYNAFIVLLSIICFKRFGFMRDKNYIKSSSLRIIISCFLVYLLVTSSLGLVLGFRMNVFNLNNIQTWTRGILLTSITIVAEEIIRYVIASQSKSTKKPIIFYTIILILLNIIIQINPEYFTTRWKIFVFITTVALPYITDEAISSYLSYQAGFVSSLVYKLGIHLYIFMIPILPNIGDYLYSVFRIFVPFFIYMYISKMVNYHDKEKKYSKQSARRIVLVPVVCLLVSIIILTSGITGYQMIAIGSGSMEPTFYKGDAVIFKKCNANKIKKGQIIAFEHDHIIITHRVQNIVKKHNTIQIKTKGDNNKTPDNYIVDGKDVIGEVKCVVKYIGYPTIWINETTKG